MSKIYKKQVGGDHYKSMVIQPSEFINKNDLPFAEGNAIKYLCRHKQKNQKEDLLKAKHYIDMAIDRDYPEEINLVCKESKSNEWIKNYNKWKKNKKPKTRVEQMSQLKYDPIID
tara:strand:+ start:213 stop:557 length:345 start_codon:yes stop_codon:yes gene_type:complete